MFKTLENNITCSIIKTAPCCLHHKLVVSFKLKGPDRMLLGRYLDNAVFGPELFPGREEAEPMRDAERLQPLSDSWQSQ